MSRRHRALLLALTMLVLTTALATTACMASPFHVPVPFGVVGLVIFALDIVAIVQIIQGGGDTTRKLLWILLILLFPVVGLILWFLLGRTKSL